MNLKIAPQEVKTIHYQFLAYSCYIKCSDCGGTGSRKGAPMAACAACRDSRNLQIENKCLVCVGLGKYPVENCVKCKGEGRVMARRRVEVKIPRNAGNHSVIQIKGAGHCGFRGLKNGDLFIEVLIDQKKIEQGK